MSNLSHLSRWSAGFALMAGAILPARAQTTAPAPPAQEETVILSPFSVTSQQDKGYGVTHSIGASRINLPIREIPTYTVTINDQFMKDVTALELTEATRFVSGMETTSSGRNGQTTLRGYEVGTANWRDGIPENLAFGGVVFTDMGDTERVEIIKGPSGVLYGSHSMGGLINRVSKMPLPVRRSQVELNVGTGSEKFIRGMFDTTGPVGDAGTAYRVIATWRDGEFDFGGRDERKALTGAISHPFGDRRQHRVYFRAQYIDNDVNDDQFSWFVDKDQKITVGITPSDYTYAPVHDAHKYNFIQNMEAGAEFSFNRDWNLRVLARSTDFDGDKRASYNASNIYAIGANRTQLGTRLQVSWKDPRIVDWEVLLQRRFFYGVQEAKGLYVDLAGKFDLGPTDHTLIVTGNYGESSTRRYWHTANLPRVSIFTPPDWESYNFQANESAYTASSDTESTGEGRDFGVQDNIAMFDRRLIAVAGARYDSGKGTSRNNLNKVSGTSSNSAWTYKAGLVGTVTNGVSVFLNRSTTFQFVSSVDENGNKFPNRDGFINEGGLKLELGGGNLVATGSYFDMELTNVLITVPLTDAAGNNIGGTVQRPVGAQNTTGFEFDLAWRALPNLDLFAAYGDVDSTDELGRSFRGVGQGSNYKFFGRYELDSGPLDGAYAGLGYNYVNRRAGDAANTFYHDPYGVWEGLLGYQTGRWNFQINVYNLADKLYSRASVSNLFVIPGPQRTFRFTTRFSF